MLPTHVAQIKGVTVNASHAICQSYDLPIKSSTRTLGSTDWKTGLVVAKLNNFSKRCVHIFTCFSVCHGEVRNVLWVNWLRMFLILKQIKGTQYEIYRHLVVRV